MYKSTFPDTETVADALLSAVLVSVQGVFAAMVTLFGIDCARQVVKVLAALTTKVTFPVCPGATFEMVKVL